MNKLVSNAIRKMINYFDGDILRINHALKVYGFAKSIGELEGLEENKLQLLEVAAVLHDIGIKESERKYNSSAGQYQQIEGPGVARTLLDEYNLGEKFLSRIDYLIGNHHTYSKIDDIDFRILVEADFLVNIFEDNIDRTRLLDIRDKYFRTKAGINYLESMYICQN